MGQERKARFHRFVQYRLRAVYSPSGVAATFWTRVDIDYVMGIKASWLEGTFQRGTRGVKAAPIPLCILDFSKQIGIVMEVFA